MNRLAALQRLRERLRRDLQGLVPLMTLLEVADDAVHVPGVVVMADLLQRLRRLEPAAAAPADVIPTEERALAPGNASRISCIVLSLVMLSAPTVTSFGGGFWWIRPGRVGR